MRKIMRSIELFTYDELSEESKQRAREQFTSEDYPATGWHEAVYEAFREDKTQQGVAIGELAHLGFYTQLDGAAIVRAGFLSPIFKHLGLEEVEVKAITDLYAADKVTFSIHHHEHGLCNYRQGKITIAKYYGKEHAPLVEKVKNALYGWMNAANAELYKRLREDYEAYHSRANIEEEINKKNLEYDHLGTHVIV